MKDISPRLTAGQIYALSIILIAGLALRLLIAWSPSNLLIQKTLPDDAFYYFAIARNVWAGNGLSVDGITPTNGFHPLWVLALLLPFAAVHNGNLPVHLGLSLAALFDVGAAWLAYQITRRVTGSAIGGMLAAGLYTFSPLVAMESLNGLETALGVFCFALTAFIYLTRIDGQEAVTAADWTLLGLVTGLMLLARTDTLLFAIVLGLHALWRRRHALVHTVAGLTLAVVVTALLLAPWLFWNLTTLGTIVQSSAVAAPTVFRRALFEPLANGVPFAEVWRNGFWPVIYLSLLFAFRYAGLPWTALAAAAILKRVSHTTGQTRPGGERETPQKREKSHVATLFLPFIGATLPLLIHTFIRWYPRSWYYIPLAWASALATGSALARIGTSLNAIARMRGVTRAGLATLGLVLVLQGVKSWGDGFYPWQSHMLAGARWVERNTPDDAIIASFNTGLQAYYGQRPVVNLDGVVDWGAIRAGESRSLLSYARRRGATHLLDYSAYVLVQFVPYMEPGYQDCLIPVASLSPEYPPYGRVTAYRIEPDCP